MTISLKLKKFWVTNLDPDFPRHELDHLSLALEVVPAASVSGVVHLEEAGRVEVRDQEVAQLLVC